MCLEKEMHKIQRKNSHGKNSAIFSIIINCGSNSERTVSIRIVCITTLNLTHLATKSWYIWKSHKSCFESLTLAKDHRNLRTNWRVKPTESPPNDKFINVSSFPLVGVAFKNRNTNRVWKAFQTKRISYVCCSWKDLCTLYTQMQISENQNGFKHWCS